MSTRINLLPYRAAQRQAARRQFGVLAAAAAGIGLAVIMAAHGVIAGYIQIQEAKNTAIAAENKKLDEQIEDIKRLRAEIDALKARKTVIESLQADRVAAAQILDQMVRLAPDGIYLKTLKQQGLKVTMSGYATTNDLVASFMLGLGDSKYLRGPALVEIKASNVGPRRLSEFTVTAELIRVQKAEDKKPGTQAEVKKPGVSAASSAASAPAKK